MEKSVRRTVEKGAISAAQKEGAIARLRGATKLEEVAGADIIIEAIVENLEVKRDTYARLDALCKPETVFASNTSSLSITEMMTATGADRRRRLIGTHFFHPVPFMKLVAVIRTILTDDDVYAEAVSRAESMGKTVVRAGDKTGFIVNRLLVPFMLDAIRALEEGLASVEDIDNAMKLGCNHPMGPLTL